MYTLKIVNKLLLKYIKRIAPDLPDNQVLEMAAAIPAMEYKRGSVLVRPGEVAKDCYFVLSGCLRLFLLDEEGVDTTVDFYTEEQSLVIYEGYKNDSSSDYGVECVEDCLLIAGDRSSEEQAGKQFSGLSAVTRNAMEDNLSQGQNAMASFKAMSPEARYTHVLETRPGLAGRVPQHQLASYLGIKPESLSRIKKRLFSSDKKP